MSAIMRFRFGYSVTLTPGQRAIAQPFIREPLPEEIQFRQFEGDVLSLLRALPDVEITIVSGELAATAWEVVTERLERIEQRVADATPVVNERCNVVVPGLGLMEIREVCVENDFCTEMLQQRLNEGWRILAICVQPDQRRPDYVLGRNQAVTQ